MHEFTLWAPKAKRLSVKIGEATYAMTGPDNRGWWRIRVEQAAPGTDYAFLIDDDPTPYPDPRSPWQPEGVHGPSRLYDHAAFRWSDSAWQPVPLGSAIIYELHIGTFTRAGTLDAAIARLDYLADLGITHVELMPVAEFPGNHGWGYDGVALFAVSHAYGGPDALKRFVDAAHSRGLAVLLDVVYNHFGPVGNYTGKFGPYLTTKHTTPWGDAVNFEGPGSDQVRRFFADNALMWMRDYHIDGLRLDAVTEFVDRSAVHFLEQLSAETAVLSTEVGRPLVLIAESDLNDPRIVRPREDHGYGIDAQWSDDFHHALFTVLDDNERQGYYIDFGSIAQLAKSLTDAYVYDGAYSVYRSRNHGRPIEGLSGHHFLGYIQNHDQVGNRAIGDRVAQSAGFDRAKIAAAIVFAAPFVPMIFQGEEFAASTPFLYFADHEDPEMARAVSEGRRREFAAFGWPPEKIPDPENPETFLRSKLDWKETGEGDHAEMLDWYRRLIHLRRTTPSLNDGNLDKVQVSFDEEKRWLTIDRGPVRVLCNLGNSAVESLNPGGYPVALASRKGIEAAGSKVTLPPDSLAILLRAM
ncbi:MAG TPA: malto-oligosyltrehalose trehalohydrolase [Silvibacterium sp.]|nr:malto-oligosyltrehalose trehalohydrolase [Silvibacterium sp.]